MRRGARKWDWFRLHGADWDTPEISTLGLDAQGFLLLLLRRMLDQMSPLSEGVVLMLGRQYNMSKKSVLRLLETLIDRDLIFATDAGFWSEIAEREFTFRDAKSENISKRNAKVSQKRWKKSEQIQSNIMPEEERDREGQAPSGPDPSGANTADNLDAREAHLCASPSGLDGRTDASGDFEYWCDVVGVGAAEIDITDAPKIELVVTDEDISRLDWEPDLEASFRDEAALDAPVVPSKIFRSGDDPAGHFSGLTDDEACAVEDDTAAAELVQYLAGIVDGAYVERIVPRLVRLVRVGELTRHAYFELIGVPMMGMRNV